MFASFLWMTMALAAPADSVSRAPSAGDAVIPFCEVASIERQEVPGSDPGVLVEMNVKEGTMVSKDMIVGRTDDREAKAMLTVKQLEAEAAEQEAKSDIGVRYQKATADVAREAYNKLIKANEGSKGAVSEIEVLRTLLEWEKAKLGILKEQEANANNRLTAEAKKAEAEAAEVVVARRTLRAPFDGVVLSVKKHVGEWVAAGEPVLEIVRVDRLSVRGGLVADEWARTDIEGRNVTVEVRLPRGRVEKVPGKVVFVSPVVESGTLNVWAEIDSPKDKEGRYLVPAGLTATMTIHANPPQKPNPTVAPRGKATDKATTKS